MTPRPEWPRPYEGSPGGSGALAQGQQQVLAPDPAVLHRPTMPYGRPEGPGQLGCVAVEHVITHLPGGDVCGGLFAW